VRLQSSRATQDGLCGAHALTSPSCADCRGRDRIPRQEPHHGRQRMSPPFEDWPDSAKTAGTQVAPDSWALTAQCRAHTQIQHRHGVDNDEGLNKVLNSDGSDPNVPKSKQW